MFKLNHIQFPMKKTARNMMRSIFLVALFQFVLNPCLSGQEEVDKWWRGNLHTHTLWSDGDDYPEVVAKWYKDNGYHFLALSDHNIFQNSERWTSPEKNKGGVKAMKRYVSTFGDKWVEKRVRNGQTEIRLKTFSEFSDRLSQDGRFLLIPSEEITARYLTSPIHMNASNLQSVIKPASGESVLDVMQNNVDLVIQQRKETGQPILIHLNHPNFGWGVTAEELMKVEGENFFEVYNGHPSVRNIGDKIHASTEKMWDIILTWRLAVLGMKPMYGLATDDSHNYFTESRSASITGRGWIMVKSPKLEPNEIINAIENGDFYASSGVEIKKMTWEKSKTLSLHPKAEEGEEFTFTFIGTRKGFDRTNKKIRTTSGDALRITHRYSDDIGEIFQITKGKFANYKPKGDELYVRCLIESNKDMERPLRDGDKKRAWIQPLVF